MASEAHPHTHRQFPGAASSKRPAFVVLGGHRCATTSLHHYLRQHPQLYLSARKGTDFFTNAGRSLRPGEFPVATTVDDYDAQFAGAAGGQTIVEVSSVYLHNPEAAPVMRDVVPDAQLIAVLRHPVERAYSHFLATYRWNADEIDFERILDPEFVRPSRYAAALEAYDAVFGRGRVRLLLYEDFVADPRRFVRGLFEWMSVDSGFVPDVSARHHLGGIPRSRRVLGFLSRPNRVSSFVDRLDRFGFYPRLRDRAARSVLARPAVPAPIAKELRERLRADVLAVQGRIDRDVRHWLA